MAVEEKDAVEKLKKELYSRKERPTIGKDIRTPLSSSNVDTPRAWEQEETSPEKIKPARPPLAEFMNTPKRGMPFAAKFLLISTLFFIAAAGVAAYFFFGGANFISPQNIDLQVIAPSLIDGGKEATLQVIIDNRNKAALTMVNMLVNYPDGTRSVATSSGPLQHDSQTIGTIASGGQVKRTINAIFYGQEGTQETVNVTLQYSIPGSSAIFTKEGQANFLIGSSPVSVSVNAPNQTISGQPFAMDVTVQANGIVPVQDVLLQAQYPFGFSLSSSTPAAQAGGTLWRLGTLQPGSAQIIHIEGSLQGQNGDEGVFHFLSGSDSNPTDTQIAVPFLSIPTTITITQPFITASFALNGQSGQTISIAPGSAVQGVITWQNNLPTAISNASFQLSINGTPLDPTSVEAPNGFYQSSDSSIIWDSQNDPALASIPAGASGTLQFSFATIRPSATAPYLNPTMMLSLTLSGSRNDEAGGPQVVSSVAMAQVNIASLVALGVQALHFTGPFSDGGPMPPVPGQNTTYTIEWTITNSSNSLANTQVSTTLPPYVQFVAAQPGSGITYTAPSRTVTWNLGDVAAAAGYGNTPPQAAFQVALLPSVSQVGQSPALTGETTLSGSDRFAQVGVQASANSPTIQLTGDTGYSAAMGAVAAGQ